MAQAPARPQQEAPAQGGGALVVFEGFDGLNTQPTRYGIEDRQAFVMDGFFPAGNDNARVIPDNGPAIGSFAGVVVYYNFGNIGATPYGIIFTADGAIWSLNTDTLAINMIGAQGTIVNPGLGNIGVSQWGSQYILIVAVQANGYFLWDGTVLYGAGAVVPQITDGPGPISVAVQQSGGSGYAAGDTGTITGGINDATYVINSVNADSHGTGYAPNDTGTVSGGNLDATYIVNTVDGFGGVTGMHITAPGTNYLTTSDIATATGGGQPGAGVGLTLNITVSSPPGPITGFTLSAIGVVTGFTITNVGTLYNPGSVVPTADGGAQPGAGIGFTLNILTVSGATMPFGIGGSTIETYASHVWIGNSDNLIFSGPSSVTDFSTSNGGGQITSNDSTLRFEYTRLKQSNGYLYLFGDSSISYIAGVQTSGSPPTTSFSLQNVDPEVGTPWGDTVNTLGSNIVFTNPWGVHVSFGGRAAKVSPELDGVLGSLPFFAGHVPSAAKAILFGRRVWVLLATVIDQITSQQVQKLFLWDEKKWCSTPQSAALTFVASQEEFSVLTAWGTDGTSLYRLFQTPSTSYTKYLRSKLWAPMSYAKTKAENRLWGIIQFYSGGSTTITVSVDSEKGPSPKTIAISPPSVVWLNNMGLPVTWKNNAAVTVVWTTGAQGMVVLGPESCGQQGALVGFTISTNAPDIAIVSMATMPVDVQYRG